MATILLFVGIFLLALLVSLYTTKTILKQKNKEKTYHPTKPLPPLAGQVKKQDVDFYGKRTGQGGYFASFQFTNGDIVEYQVPKTVYDSLKERDYGKLSYQGEKFISFQARF